MSKNKKRTGRRADAPPKRPPTGNPHEAAMKVLETEEPTPENLQKLLLSLPGARVVNKPDGTWSIVLPPEPL